MAELERERRRIINALQLQSVVRIMKAMASANIMVCEESMRSLNEYNKTIELGLQIVLQNNKGFLASRPEDERRRLGAVVFGSEQGLCGRFNEIVVRYALDRLAEIEHEERKVLAVGRRAYNRLQEAGQPVEAHFSFSGDFLGISEVMAGVLARIDQWRLQSDVSSIVLFYNRPLPGRGGEFFPRMAYLFPVDAGRLAGLARKKWVSNSLPTYSMQADQLFSSLLREHLFFSLYRAFAESLASENFSRLSSMQAAERNIEEHLNALMSRYRKQRQEAISSELLDILTGYEAISSE